MLPTAGDWLAGPGGYFNVKIVYEFYSIPELLQFIGTFYMDGYISRKGCLVSDRDGNWKGKQTGCWEIVTDEELLALLELRTL